MRGAEGQAHAAWVSVWLGTPITIPRLNFVCDLGLVLLDIYLQNHDEDRLYNQTVASGMSQTGCLQDQILGIHVDLCVYPFHRLRQ